MADRRKKKRSALGQFVYGSRYRVGEYALRGFVSVLPWLPYRYLTAFTSFCARLTFAVLWDYRTRMEENVSLALGDRFQTPAERKRLIWRAWRNFARGVLETTAVMHFDRDKILNTILLEGEQHLTQALSQGRGVLALSAHLGTFTLIGARLAAAGYPFSVVVKDPGDERFARLITDFRLQVGIQTISAKPRREAVRGILKALRENRIVLVIADEFKSGDIMVDFMGQTAPAPRGPATLALRTGAVTLPMFAIRQPDDSLILTIEAAIEPIRKQDLEESVAATTAIYTRHLEAAIRCHPEQWNWLGFPRKGRISRAQMAQAMVGAKVGQ
jgi:Kdo2-lipid IVA lauroyltransferase/acyltransferase